MNFSSVTEKEKKEMLSAAGAASFEDLVRNIPKKARFSHKNGGVLAEYGISEMETAAALKALASRNRTAEKFSSFLGAGAYHHFIPSAVGMLASRGEFLTAYTPYQAEASQGTLQATFEYQTMAADLYGMDVANASLYDGGSALAEAALMAVHETGRKKILLSASVHPETQKVVRTYCQNFEIVAVPMKDGATDAAALEKILDENTACLLLQSPNFFGVIEDGKMLADAVHAKGALLAVSADPLSLGILTPPGEFGADIAVGEGQSIGNPLNYGGPYLGIFTCKQKHMRRLPGRVVGITKDKDGKRGFVLTLQTREQHIRREKATSNICSNEALVALSSGIYLSLLGPEGLKESAKLNIQKAHYAADEISKVPGFSLAFPTPFFNEFVIRSEADPEKINKKLLEQNILGGLPLKDYFPDLASCSLYCATEMNSKEQIDTLASTLRKGGF